MNEYGYTPDNCRETTLNQEEIDRLVEITEQLNKDHSDMEFELVFERHTFFIVPMMPFPEDDG